MTGAEQELRETFSQASAMPDGPAKFEALDSAIRRADASGNGRLAFEFRHHAVEAFVFGGDDRRAFLAFSQSLAAFDRDGTIATDYVAHSILWQFKWIVNALTDFPDVPLERTYAVLDDMQRRYLRGGHSLHAVHQGRWQIALHVGDLEQAERSYHDMLTAKQDSLSNCSTCVPSAQTRFLSAMGRYEEAVRVGEPVRRGQCRRQPQWVQAYLMLPYLKTGRPADAADVHRGSYRKMRLDHTDLSGIALHLDLLGRTGNETRGLELVEKHLPWMEVSPTPKDSLRFAASAVMVLSRLADNGFGDLTLAGRPGGGGRREQTTVDALRAELTAHTRALAARFDARNGTSHQGTLAEQRMAAQPLVPQLSLSVLDSTSVKPKKLARIQERIAAHTTTGDLAEAARARLDAALAMRRSKRTEDAYAAAEEAVLALERAGLTDELWLGRHLLWELYRADYRHRDAALAALDQLLTAESLPGALPSRAELTEQGAGLVWGSESAARYLSAADLHRADGAAIAELRTLRHAIEAVQSDTDDDAVEWLRRADAITCPAGDAEWVGEKARLDMAAARLWQRREQAEPALERALAAVRHFAEHGDVGDQRWAGWLAATLLLRLQRPREAEEVVRPLLTEDFRSGHILRVLALRARGRTREAQSVIEEHEIQEWEFEEIDED